MKNSSGIINYIKNGIIVSIGILFLLILISFSSCSETNSTKDEAVLMSLNVLRNTPGYDWFQPNFNDYKPDTTLTNQIKNQYKPSVYSFLTFVNQSCSCSGTQILFPRLMKILVESGVSESNIIIYSMSNVKTPNPYTNKISLNQLPSLFSVKDSIAQYSVTDSLSNIQKIYPDSLVTLEMLILYSIQK